MIKSADKGCNGLWAYLFLLYAAVVLLYPVIITQTASFCIKQDNLHQAYPFINKLSIALHKGYLPVWDANTYGGKNFSGELQTGIFYPINIIWCFLFGSVRGMDTYYLDLLVSFHFLLCLIGMYRAARVFQLSILGAIAAALVFTFTSAVAARAGGQTCIFYGLTLLPWAIYFVGKYYWEQRKRKNLIFAGLLSGLEILAGHMEPFFHCILIIGIIIFFYEYHRGKRLWSLFLNTGINLLLILLVAFLLALPQLYYASEYLARCYRTVSGGYFIEPGQKVPLYIYAHWFIINLSNLGNLLGQDYAQPDDDNIIYMGILPLLLVIVYLFRYKTLNILREHAGLTKLLSIILGIGGLSVLGYLSFFYLILYEIPFVNLVRQLGRYIILISFSSSLLLGLAITYLAELKEWIFKHSSKTKLYILSALTINALYWVFFQQKLIPLAVSIPFLTSFIFLLFLLTVKKAPINIAIVAVGVICIDLCLNPVSYLPAQKSYYPDYFYARNRIIDSLEKTYGKYRVSIEMEDYGQVRRNLGDLYNIQTKFGYGATVNKTYSDFIGIDPTINSEINDLLNVKYIITDKLLDSSFVFKDSTQHLNLYERKNWYPRCYWKRQLGMKGREIEAENQATIQPLAYSDYYQKLQIGCNTSDTLIFSENYYPGWECYDNGKKIPIYPAAIKNYPSLFRCIKVDQGQHIIEFTYKKVFHWF